MEMVTGSGSGRTRGATGMDVDGHACAAGARSGIR